MNVFAGEVSGRLKNDRAQEIPNSNSFERVVSSLGKRQSHSKKNYTVGRRMLGCRGSGSSDELLRSNGRTKRSPFPEKARPAGKHPTGEMRQQQEPDAITGDFSDVWK
ncbi:hypothetical protein RUM44_006574 [Polyplax serrata]|uniref:Uncharacterized protein n=1 Tax=Polyplax serrata TaxID=468196 RepID=A0ABR1AIH3_POLSC